MLMPATLEATHPYLLQVKGDAAFWKTNKDSSKSKEIITYAIRQQKKS